MKSKFPTPGKYDLGIFPPEILGHIEYTFGKPTKPALPAGTHVLDIKFGLPDERDWLLYVPESLDTTKPAKLLLMYHGAGGFADKVMPFFKEHADKNGFLLVIPQSTYVT
ncbi:MAG: hypothetical protein HUK22_07585, partial [Thermoguttaceae bacterium]|nr:hypothetical protein [Thermoguttaceae bacterium]